MRRISGGNKHFENLFRFVKVLTSVAKMFKNAVHYTHV